LLRYRVQNAAVVVNDPEVAAECHRHRIGDKFHVKLGGKVDRFHGETLSLEVLLKNKTDGRFKLENPHSHLASVVGMHADMGPTATIECAGVSIVVSSQKVPPWDLGQLRSQGVAPEKCYMIGVKAAAAHRAAYDPIAKHSFYVDTPGLASSNLKGFRFRHVRRPIYPLDEFKEEPRFE
jgi:microcystin degradation protein MlrC